MPNYLKYILLKYNWKTYLNFIFFNLLNLILVELFRSGLINLLDLILVRLSRN